MDLKCPDCGRPTELATHPQWTYPNGKLRKYHRCGDRLFCTATHWAHLDGTPLGVPGDRATKTARSEAHEALDRLQTRFGMHKALVYFWLQRTMQLSVADAHIGRFTTEQCNEVVRLVNAALEPDQSPRIEEVSHYD